MHEIVMFWSDTFKPYTPTHTYAILCGIALVIIMILIGWWLRRVDKRNGLGNPTEQSTNTHNRSHRRTYEIILGLIIFLVWATQTIWWFLPARFTFYDSFPFHVCDILGLIVSLTFIFGHRILRSQLYYWGVGLSHQAIITPTLIEGPTTFIFWLFWLVHFFIIGGALYSLIIDGFRPNWKDYTNTLKIGVVYISLMLILNILLETNYAYVGNSTPNNKSVIDILGPWPWRIIPMVLIGTAWMALLTVPWEVVSWFRKRKTEPRP